MGRPRRLNTEGSLIEHDPGMACGDTCSIDLPRLVSRSTVGSIPSLIMVNRFLTISEAENFTGKSRSTLRRFIDNIVKADNSPDRPLLLPTQDEVLALRERNQPFAWKISEELLRRQFLKPENTDESEGEKGSEGTPQSESPRLVAVLEKSLAILERELTEKNNQIKALNERLHESNVLQKDLQLRLASPAGKEVSPQATDVSHGEPEKKEEKKPPRMRPFRWLFGG